MHARNTEAKCFDLRCFREVFLDDHFKAVNERTKLAKRVFLSGIIICTLGVVGFGIYVIVVAGECYGKCKIHAWIPSYLLFASLAEMARMPVYFTWLFDRDPEDLTFTAFDIYRLGSWCTIISISIFGSIVVFPYVTDFQDLWHYKRADQCPCFYWSFWWLAGTWFALFLTFSCNWLMYVATPCMHRIIEERERRYYENQLRYDEKNRRQRYENAHPMSAPNIEQEPNERAPLRMPSKP